MNKYYGLDDQTMREMLSCKDEDLKATQSALEQSQERCMDVTVERDVASEGYARACKKLAAMTKERDEWKAKHAQVHKDLGCELSDPNGTIWQHAARVEADNQRLTERVGVLEAALATAAQDHKHEAESRYVGICRTPELEWIARYYFGDISAFDKHLSHPAQPEATEKGSDG